MLTTNTPNIIPPSTVMNATINSMAMQLLNAFGYSIQIEFTGTPTGSFKLQCSDDPVPKQSQTFQANGVVVYTPVNWTDVLNSTFTVTAAGNVCWNVQNPMYNYVRVVYTDTSGGTSTAIVTSAVFNSKGY
jgi:hypothetical protein